MADMTASEPLGTFRLVIGAVFGEGGDDGFDVLGVPGGDEPLQGGGNAHDGPLSENSTDLATLTGR